MSLGWGTGGWGHDRWGFGTPFTEGPELFIQSAFAVTTHSVRVLFSTEPLTTSTTTLGSATNPNEWTVTRLNDGFQFTVQAIIEQPSVIFEGSNTPVFDVYVLEPLGSLAIALNVSAPNLLRADDQPMIPPTDFGFVGLAGLATERPEVPIQRQINTVDVANPPFPPTGQSIGGTLVINPSGDYQSTAGAELVRKLIIRRLTTPLGGFFHLPDYGFGVGVKEKFSTTALILLKAQLEKQILLETEVEAASVTPVFQPTNNLLLIQIQAKLRPSGDTLKTTVSVSQGGIVF